MAQTAEMKKHVKCKKNEKDKKKMMSTYVRGFYVIFHYVLGKKIPPGTCISSIFQGHI